MLASQVVEVLLVDDSPADLYLAKDGLAKHCPALELRTATDGENAIEELERNPITDVMILDLNMPRVDGFGVLEVVRQRELSIRVIVLSSSCDPEDERRAVAMGAKAYLRKPSSLREFDEVLSELCDKWIRPIIPGRISSR